MSEFFGKTGAGSSDGTPRKATGMASAGAENFSVADAIGGPRGLIEGIAPVFLFTILYTITKDLQTSLIAAVAVAAVAVLARLVSRTTVMPGVVGVAGVLFNAYLVYRSGDPKDFFLPGLFINAGYGSAFFLSTLALPAIKAIKLPAGPWPILGLALGPVTGEMLSWKQHPERLAAYIAATRLWAGMFALRFVVQTPLYIFDQFEALGVARLLMGTPLFVGCAWVTYLLLRKVPPRKTSEPESPPQASE